VKAIYLVRFGKPEDAFEIRDVAMPEPSDSQVRVKVEAFGLNYADVTARQGRYRDCPPLPCVLGYDAVGVVDAISKNVTNVKVGDRVTLFTLFNGYAEYIVADYRAATKIPENFLLPFAAALATQYCTAYYASCECVNVHEGDVALVHAAAGGVGTALIQMLLYKGAVIIGTCGSQEKVEHLRKSGVQYPINYNTSDYREEIKKILGDRKLDLVFDSLGGKYVSDGIKLLATGGKLVMFGGADVTSEKNFFKRWRKIFQFGFYHPGMFMMASKSLIGISMLKIGKEKPEIISRVLREVVALGGKNVLTPSGGQEFPVSQLAEAHYALEQRRTLGKVVVKW